MFDRPLEPWIMPETDLRRRARAVLAYVAGSDPSLEVRFASLDAISALDEHFPPGAISDPFCELEVPGTLREVLDLFDRASAIDVTAHALLSRSRAVACISQHVGEDA
jgi:hypothetical protein